MYTIHTDSPSQPTATCMHGRTYPNYYDKLLAGIYLYCLRFNLPIYIHVYSSREIVACFLVVQSAIKTLQINDNQRIKEHLRASGKLGFVYSKARNALYKYWTFFDPCTTNRARSRNFQVCSKVLLELFPLKIRHELRHFGCRSFVSLLSFTWR